MACSHAASPMKHLLILLLYFGALTPGMTAEKAAKPSGRVQVAAKMLTPAERLRLLGILNEGDDQVLQSLPGIGATRAAAIRKARPILDPVELVKVGGVGDQIFVDIIAHAKAGFPNRRAGKPESSKNERAAGKAK